MAGAVKSEVEKFEAMLEGLKVHTNVQTFTASSDTPMFETIDTPGVSIASRTACLITRVSVLPDFQNAHATQFDQWRTQIAGGTQTAFLNPEDQKYVGEIRLYAAFSGVGAGGWTQWPLVWDNPWRPMLIVVPQMTIGHVCTEMVDAASDEVRTMFNYQVMPLSMSMHSALLQSQMNLT